MKTKVRNLICRTLKIRLLTICQRI